MKSLPPVIIMSGPSGSGKSTVIARLLERRDLPLHLSVSATTRKPRPGEQDGVHYFFWTRTYFEDEVRKQSFLEWAEVHGHCYGTLRREVEPYRALGDLVILDIDVQGAAQVRERCPDNVSIFLRTATLAEYEERLRVRGTESEEAIERRVATARCELAQARAYDYQVINEDLDRAVAQVHAILKYHLERDAHAR